ncbi:MAG: PEP-CTERM sorting domain-containing protein [Methylophilaceae bacterium]
MNFKMKTLVAATLMAVTMSGAANAATNGATGNSSVIFSAWDDNGSYSLDLGTYLNDFIGADNAANISKAGTVPNTSFAGAVAVDGTLFDIKLTGFNLTSGLWNLAAADTSGRQRLLLSEIAPLAPTNINVKNSANSLNTYVGTGAAASTVTGTVGTASDPYYANSAVWGDGIGGQGITGTANALGASSNLVVAWATSATAGNAAGFANLTAGGKDVIAFTHVVGADTYLTIATAPVPEANTWAMMLAGLGLLGFVARRRS